MSIPPRPAKCESHSRSLLGQVSPPVHLATASPSGRTIGLPHDGQWVGIDHSRSSPVRSDTTGATTSGITSPARRTSTRSPIRTSLSRTMSSLCNVASPTVAPPTTTGSSTANGVTAPVLPTLTWMSRSTVVCSSGGNLKAIAQRGAAEVNPSTSWSPSESTLTTTPSVWYPLAWRRCSARPTYFSTASRSGTTEFSGLTLIPRSLRYSIVSLWLRSLGPPSITPAW